MAALSLNLICGFDTISTVSNLSKPKNRMDNKPQKI
jgi:hypothetical protein